MRLRLDPFSPSGVSIVPDAPKLVHKGGYAGSPDITRLIQPGTNVTFTGSGTQQSPYIVNSSGGGGSTARTTRFVVAPYGDTRTADYTCATSDSNQTEINQAINAATLLGGVVDLLDGDFYVSTAIVPKDNVWLRGQGMFATRIGVKAGLGSSFSIIDNFAAHNAEAEPTWYGGKISDLELDGSNMNNTQEGKGIFGIKLEYCAIERVYCHDTTATGIGADDYIGSTIKDCIVADCGYMNTATITNIVYSANTFTVTAPSHGKSVSDNIVITGMTPRQYNGRYLVTSVTNANTFVIDTSNNAGKLQLSLDPGTATVFGRISDYNIGHSGIGIASGAYIKESNLVTGNYCFRNQNNNIFIETNDNVTGLNAGYVVTGNFSYDAGQCGFRNTGTRNLTFTDNFDYGSLIGGQMSPFYLTKTITAASWSASVVTFTTSTAHALTMLPTPLKVTIAGMTPSGYNGTYVVTSVPSTTTFTVALTADPGTATVFGTAYEEVHPVSGSSFKNNIFSHNGIYGYYHEPMGEDTAFVGNTIKYCGFYGAYLTSGQFNFTDNKVYSNGRQGVVLSTGSITKPITDVIIHNNQIYNNGTNVAGTYDGIDIDSSLTTPLSHVSVRGNHVYDNQVIQTQRYGVLIRSGGNNSYITVKGNDLTRNLTAPMLIQDTSNTIYVDDNDGVNPRGRVSLGNITGAVTIDCTLGDSFKGILTGDITPAIAGSVVDGHTITLVLQQDSTGGRTWTPPGNVALAASSFVLSTAANAIDSISLRYDLGTTKWRELSRAPGRAISIVEGGTGATTASAARTALGLAIGSNVQAFDADLSTIAGLTATTDNFIVSVANAWASRTPAQVRSLLALVIGTNVQAWDADLDTWATKTAPSGTVVGTSDTQILTGKTIDAASNTLTGLPYVVMASTNTSTPADATTYYFGGVPVLALQTTAAIQRIYLPKAGTITAVRLTFYQTVGSNETSTASIRLNNTSDTTISAAVTNDATTTTFLASGLSIAMTTSDYVEIKWVTPTWVATNPTNLRAQALIYAQTT